MLQVAQQNMVGAAAKVSIQRWRKVGKKEREGNREIVKKLKERDTQTETHIDRQRYTHHIISLNGLYNTYSKYIVDRGRGCHDAQGRQQLCQ